MKTLSALALAIATFTPVTLLADEYPPVEKNVVITINETTLFNFPFDQAVVISSHKEEFLKAARTLARQLLDNRNLVIRIEGHTDITGTEEYNMKLSRNRVESFVHQLNDLGVKLSQIQGVAYGEVNPLMDGHSDEAWQTNRRVVIKLIEMSQ